MFANHVEARLFHHDAVRIQHVHRVGIILIVVAVVLAYMLQAGVREWASNIDNLCHCSFVLSLRMVSLLCRRDLLQLACQNPNSPVTTA